MPLTPETLRTLHPTGRTQRLFDTGGLYLEVSPRGGTWWRFRYRFDGREKRLSLGVFPQVGLDQARLRRDEARELLHQGRDPSAERQARRRDLLEQAVGSPGGVGDHGAATATASTLGLRQFPLFAELSDQELAEVARRCVWRHYAKGQVVLQRGIKDDVILVVSGAVKVSSIDAGGREVAFIDLAPRRLFGDTFALLDQPFALSAVASASSVVAKLHRHDFMRLLTRYPSFQLRLLRLYAFIVTNLALRVIDLSTLPVPARICTWLLRFAQPYGGADAAREVRLSPAPTQQSLADMLGTSREQIARAFAMLQRQGLIHREGRTLLLPDTAALLRFLQDHGADISLFEHASYGQLLESFGAFQAAPDR